MATEYNDFKICVRSLLTISSKPLSILDIQKDYYSQEGHHIPYKNFGFNSVIELLQSMNDIVIVPPNPNPNSLLHLVVGEKSNHVRLLVNNTKKKKVKPNLSRSYGNNSFGGNVANKNMSKSFSNFGNNENYNCKSGQFRNTGNNYKSLPSNRGQRSYAPSSNTSIISDSNSNQSIQNVYHSPGYVTRELRADLERHISENKMIIPLNKLKELVKSHTHFKFLKASCMEDIINQVQDFLNINEKGVSLKHIHDMKTKENIPLIYQITGKNQNSLIVNNNNKSVNNSKSYECDDKLVLSNLLENLKINGDEEQDSFKNKCKNVSPINEVANKKIVKLQDINHNYNKNKNSDFAKENLKKNFELVKRQTEILQNKKTGRGNLNVSGSSDYLNNTNSLENSETSFSHSTPNKTTINDVENAKISLNVSQRIPIEVLFNIARIFIKYDKGVNIENFKFIYSKMYHTIFDSTSYGFTTTKQMVMVLDQLLEVRNNVLYTKNKLAYSTMYKNINDNNNSSQNKIIHSILSNNNQKIVLHVDQQLFKSEDFTSMVLVEAYNPSLFFLQLAYKVVELERLSKQMQCFYSEERESANYMVQPEHIVPGLIYATSYTSFESSKQWHRVRILREVDSETVHVIHVDFGTVDYIPKTELRFLKDVFGKLQCQAIHCCLTGYNELDTIAPEVTAAFLNLIGSAVITVQVDNNFLLNEQYQILHVTLTMKKSKYPKIFININDEITMWHLNTFK